MRGGLLDRERARSGDGPGRRGRGPAGGPLAAAPDQVRDPRHPECLDVMAERRVEDAALACPEREGHRMVAAGDPGSRRRQDLDWTPRVQAAVQLVVGAEVAHAGRDWMTRIEDVDVERPAGIVRVLAVPHHPGELAEPGPVA